MIEKMHNLPTKADGTVDIDAVLKIEADETATAKHVAFDEEVKAARKKALDKIVEVMNSEISPCIKGMQFPAIVIIQTDFDIDCGVDTAIYSLGLCANADIAIARAKEVLDEIGGGAVVEMSFKVKAAPIDGVSKVGTAFYIE